MNNGWIPPQYAMPQEHEEILGIFSGTSEHVWHAMKDGDKFVAACDPDCNHDRMTICGDLICWQRWPKSPFIGDDDARVGYRDGSLVPPEEA